MGPQDTCAAMDTSNGHQGTRGLCARAGPVCVHVCAVVRSRVPEIPHASTKLQSVTHVRLPYDRTKFRLRPDVARGRHLTSWSVTLRHRSRRTTSGLSSNRSRVTRATPGVRSQPCCLPAVILTLSCSLPGHGLANLVHTSIRSCHPARAITISALVQCCRKSSYYRLLKML